MSLPVLEAALEKQLGLERATRIEECFQGAPGHFLSRPPLLVAGHFDPAVDVLVVERELATLGLVYALEGPPQVLAGQVERAVERAAYMRHLLVAQPASRGDLSQPQRRRPWAVELVLASLGNAACEAEVHKALRRVAAESQLLFAVGVGLLHRDEESDVPTGAALRRAFPWLLRESRAWYQKLAPPSSSRAREQPLRTLEVENFRLPGSRRLELAEGADLHVVHGANGTGKSSLFAAMMRELEPDKGDLDLPGKTRVATVAQETPSLPDPALDFVLSGD
nr:AAA family ATPase [Thermoanaerobaculia bacterium]